MATIVSMQLHLEPFADQCVFIFCNGKRNGIKVLRYDSNDTIPASKVLLDGMKFNHQGSKSISYQQVNCFSKA